MDLWVVGAAAAAGYIAKQWKNLSRDKDGSSETSTGPSKCVKSEDPAFPIQRLIQGQKVAEDANSHRLVNASENQEASTSGYGEKTGGLVAYEECNVLSVSSFPLGYSSCQNLEEHEGKVELNGYGNYSSDEPYAGKMDSFKDCERNRISVRIKHPRGHVIRPLNSLESCVMAQLYKEHSEMQEYVFSVPSTPSTTTRPLLVTDGNQIISRANSDSCCAWTGTDSVRGLHREDNVHGVPPLPIMRNFGISKNIKSLARKGYDEKMRHPPKSGGGKFFPSQNGSNEGIILFCLGISIGVISSLMANRREVNKLKEMLNHTENLVQDLQEELEMKDSLTVRELANDNYDSQDTCQSSFHERAQLFPMQNVDDSNNDTSYDKAEESSEHMSKIEQELEAELERLGLNMHASKSERRFSDLVELHPEFEADFAQGELKVDMVGGVSVAQSESNRDASGTATTHTGNYAVSPRELSLRLHKIIQSRLEDRVNKLETALENSQRKVQFMESQKKNGRKKFSGSELRYSSGEDSPNAEGNSLAEPLVMNLSGEALNAYNEAYDELVKIKDSEEEDSPLGAYEYEHKHQADVDFLNYSTPYAEYGGANGALSHIAHDRVKTRKELLISRLNTFVEHESRLQELIYDSVSADESNGCDDEIEKQLIKQIVEKTKKGSPVVLNAQRVFLSMDDN